MAKTRVYSSSPFNKILVPRYDEYTGDESLSAARLLADTSKILLIGFVGVPYDQPLSMAANEVFKMRQNLRTTLHEVDKQIRTEVCAVYSVWEDLLNVIHKEQPDLLLSDWEFYAGRLSTESAMALGKAPCNIAVVKGPIPNSPKRILVPLRGGPYAALALRIALEISKRHDSRLTVLHILPKAIQEHEDASFKGLSRVINNLPEIEWRRVESDNAAETILVESEGFDLVLMGIAFQSHEKQPALGMVAEQLFRESETGVIAVKSKQDIPVEFTTETAGQTAISVLVDKWFAENTYQADEFQDLDILCQLKQQQRLTISLALPALNEEKSIGNVIKIAKDALMCQVPLLDEIVVVDSNSSDQTREIALQMGVPVYIHQHTLPSAGPRRGKGEALWKSLYLTRGDIVVWVDTDIVNIHPRFVYGLIGPLLIDPRIQFVKGFYQRPIKVGDQYQAGGGGRVTELTARPLINLFFPELSGVIQPLAGEYGGRRTTLEQLPFFSGYGVEIGLLIEVFERYGLSSIAQVDLLERIHRNQTLEALGKMSFAIIQAVMQKLEKRHQRGLLDDVNKTMKLIRYEPQRFFLEVEEIAEYERPPIVTLPEYLERRKT